MNSVIEQREAVPASSDDPTLESTESPSSEVEKEENVEKEEEEDMADPNSYFDITLPASAIVHRHSKSSTDSRDFDFRLCMESHPDLSASTEHPKNLSTADELFYQGRILPLYLSQGLRLSKRVSGPDTPIAFSYSLHPADVDVDVFLQPESGSSSRKASPVDSPVDSPSHESFVRAKNHSPSHESCVRAKNHSESQPVRHRGGFTWKFLGHRKRSSKVGATNCEEKICKSCGRDRNPDSESLSRSDRRIHSWISHSGGFPLPTGSDRRSSGYRASESSGRNPYQNLSKAKEFWRRYLKPFILPSSKSQRSVNSGEQTSNSGAPRSRAFKLKWRSRSRASTPHGSPTHSGILSVTTPSLSPDGVQGAIAYCKASSAS